MLFCPLASSRGIVLADKKIISADAGISKDASGPTCYIDITQLIGCQVGSTVIRICADLSNPFKCLAGSERGEYAKQCDAQKWGDTIGDFHEASF
jgi:hypothetical protein